MVSILCLVFTWVCLLSYYCLSNHVPKITRACCIRFSQLLLSAPFLAARETQSQISVNNPRNWWSMDPPPEVNFIGEKTLSFLWMIGVSEVCLPDSLSSSCNVSRFLLVSARRFTFDFRADFSCTYMLIHTYAAHSNSTQLMTLRNYCKHNVYSWNRSRISRYSINQSLIQAITQDQSH